MSPWVARLQGTLAEEFRSTPAGQFALRLYAEGALGGWADVYMYGVSVGNGALTRLAVWAAWPGLAWSVIRCQPLHARGTQPLCAWYGTANTTALYTTTERYVEKPYSELKIRAPNRNKYPWQSAEGAKL